LIRNIPGSKILKQELHSIALSINCRYNGINEGLRGMKQNMAEIACISFSVKFELAEQIPERE